LTDRKTKKEVKKMITTEDRLEDARESLKIAEEGSEKWIRDYYSLPKREQIERRNMFLKHKKENEGVVRNCKNLVHKYESKLLLERENKKEERKRKIKKFARDRLEAMAREAKRRETRYSTRTPVKRKPTVKRRTPVRRKTQTRRRPPARMYNPMFRF
jgi:hypothetical protein